MRHMVSAAGADAAAAAAQDKRTIAVARSTLPHEFMLLRDALLRSTTVLTSDHPAIPSTSNATYRHVPHLLPFAAKQEARGRKKM